MHKLGLAVFGLIGVLFTLCAAGCAVDDGPCPVPRIVADIDTDGDGVLDADDIVAGARPEADRKTRYSAAYYPGGYPPDGEGACTDVVWRAMRAAGHDLKALVDADIADDPEDYPRVAGNPDPDIDFRRVPNLVVFFSKYGESLTCDVRPGDAENLAAWQGGDIVVFGRPLEHIGIVSDRRRRDGVPLLIHNAGPHATEADVLTSWPTRITHHFRYPPARTQLPGIPVQQKNRPRD
ncbi:DUF1287 domain-containing protein [Desulforudis sp. 1031]|uniref:DUF1287 domain-containing protein n=2 Tax=Candidatus Desulforudis TaxID=471826 RepID=UPI003CE5292C